MNALLPLFARLASGDLATRIVLGVLWQTTAVILLVGVLARVFLRRDAAARHGLWLGTLAWVLLCPAVGLLADRVGLTARTLALPFPQVGVIGSIRRADPGSDATAFESVADRPETDTLDLGPGLRQSHVARDAPSRADAVRPAQVAASSMASRREAVAGGLVAVWAAGVVIGLGRIVLGWRRAAILLREARPLDPGRHGAALALAREALGEAGLPPVAASRRVAGPVALGLVRPRIVLPEGLAGALPAEALRDVLVHEAAHVRRRDPWVGLLQRVAGVLHWPNPAVRYLNGQLSRAREEVCDNHVLLRGDPCGYARTLLSLTEHCRPPGTTPAGLGLLGPRWTLSERVAGLLDPGRIAMIRPTVRMNLAVAVALAATGTLLASVRFVGATHADEPPKSGAAVAVPAEKAGDVRVAGVVVDEEGGPVAGAVVRLPNDERVRAVSAADGTFTLVFDNPIRLLWGFTAEPAGDARIGLLRFDLPQRPQTCPPLRIVVKPRRPLTVLVRDADGRPVPEADVEANEAQLVETRARTGPDGVATLRLAADARIPLVVALKSGVGMDFFVNGRQGQGLGAVPPPLPDEVSLTLDGVGPARVKAVDTEGRPIPGVLVTPWVLFKPGRTGRALLGDFATTKATTGRDGVARLDWFPAKRIFPSIFRVTSDTHSCPLAPSQIRLESEELVVRMLRKTRLGGTVRHPDGRSAGGVVVQAQGRGPGRGERGIETRTGPDGRYALDVPPEQSYIVAVADERWAAHSHTGVVVREARPRDGLDFSLVPGTLVQGRVTEGDDRRPGAGLLVELREDGAALPKELRGPSSREELSRRTVADVQGRYYFRVGPGHYTLQMQSNSQAFEVKDEPEVVRDFVADPSAQRWDVFGVVVEKTADGERPVPEALVRILSVRGVSLGVASATDAGGRFRRNLAAYGEVILYAVSPDGKLAGYSPVIGKSEEAKIVVGRAGRVEGRVVDVGGRARAKQRIFLKLASGPFYGNSGHSNVSRETDKDGRYYFGGLPVGSEGEVSAAHLKDGRPTGVISATRFVVRDADPIAVPDLVVPADAPPAGE